MRYEKNDGFLQALGLELFIFSGAFGMSNDIDVMILFIG